MRGAAQPPWRQKQQLRKTLKRCMAERDAESPPVSMKPSMKPLAIKGSSKRPKTQEKARPVAATEATHGKSATWDEGAWAGQQWHGSSGGQRMAKAESAGRQWCVADKAADWEDGWQVKDEPMDEAAPGVQAELEQEEAFSSTSTSTSAIVLVLVLVIVLVLVLVRTKVPMYENCCVWHAKVPPPTRGSAPHTC